MCPFYKIPYLGFRKLQLQNAPDFCTCRKSRATTRYKIPYIGFRKSRPKSALKTIFKRSNFVSNVQNQFKAVSSRQNHFRAVKIHFKPPNFVSSRKILFRDQKFPFDPKNFVSKQKISPASRSSKLLHLHSDKFLIKSAQM